MAKLKDILQETMHNNNSKKVMEVAPAKHDALYLAVSQINDFVDELNKAHDSIGKYRDWTTKKYFGQDVAEWPTDPIKNKKIALGVIKVINDAIETYQDQIKQIYNM